MLKYTFQESRETLIFFNSIKEDYLYNFSFTLNRPIVGPRTLQLSLTTRCNLRCVMCDAWKLQERELDVAEFKKIIDDTYRMGNLKEVLFTGGEALLRPETFDLIKYVKDYYPSTYTILNTNGLLLTGKNISGLIDTGLDNLSISIDSPVPAVHNALRGKGVLEKVIEGINYLNAEKKRRNTGYPSLVVCAVLMNQTLDTIYEMIDFCVIHGISCLVIQAYVPNVNMAFAKRDDKLWISEERLPVLREVLDKIEIRKNKIPNFHIEIPSEKIYNYFSESAFMEKCYAGFTQVLLVGEVIQFVCSGPQEKEEYKYLDTIDGDPIEKLWFSEKANYLRDTIRGCKRNCAQFCTIRLSSDSASEIHNRLLEKGNLFLVFRELHFLNGLFTQHPNLPLKGMIDSDYELVRKNLEGFVSSLYELNLAHQPKELRQYLINDLKLFRTYLRNANYGQYLVFMKNYFLILLFEKILQIRDSMLTYKNWLLRWLRRKVTV